MHIITITEDERGILLHSLGLTNSKEPYRNYFVSCDGHADQPLLDSLVDKGLMFMSRHHCYHVSAAGKAMVGIDD